MSKSKFNFQNDTFAQVQIVQIKHTICRVLGANQLLMLNRLQTHAEGGRKGTKQTESEAKIRYYKKRKAHRTGKNVDFNLG